MAHSHPHSHTGPDPRILENEKGMLALKISFVGLMATALLQAAIVWISGSTALLADTLHNLGDAFTAVPLWIAFSLQKRKPNKQFTYGFSRFEDLAGAFIVLLIFATSIVVAYESFKNFKSGYIVTHLPWVMAASIVGFIGNEMVARLRIKIGREISSPALIADGEHARADGFTSLGVLAGAIGVHFGYPVADPIVAFMISIAILKIGWDSGRELFSRLVDAVSPEIIGEVEREAALVQGVKSVLDVRARYMGREIRVDLTIAVDGNITVLEGHEIAIQAQLALQKKFPLLVAPMIHVDPVGHQGLEHHLAAHHRHEH